MYYEDTVVENRAGLHAVIAATIAYEVGSFKSDVHIINLDSGAEAWARSPIDIFMLETVKGSHVRVTAEGEDDKEAVRTVIRIIDDSADTPGR